MPHTTVDKMRDVIATIESHEVGKIIIGIPVPFSGGESDEGRAIRAFAEELGHTVELPIEFANEVFTSKIAEQMSPRKYADAAAAALILQAHLDRKISKS